MFNDVKEYVFDRLNQKRPRNLSKGFPFVILLTKRHTLAVLFTTTKIVAN